MGIHCILAMTGAEILANTALPPQIGWMACQFSPWGTGLCNLPPALPEGALLILNDQMPIQGHDPQRIAGQTTEILSVQNCCGVLLDFQRDGIPETAELVQTLAEALPCPVIVSQCYAAGLDIPVLLPPVPLDIPLKDYLKPWKGREIWLEAALDGCAVTVTEDGADFQSLPLEEIPEGGFGDPGLHCHYWIHTEENAVRFTLWRTQEDLAALLEEAAALGVTEAVGLYQELGIEKQPPG